MQAKKRFLSTFSSLILIPVVMVIILLDKPDYRFFNFIHKNTVPMAEHVGQGLTYPLRLFGRTFGNMAARKEILRDNADIIARLNDFQRLQLEKEILELENELLRQKLYMAADIGYRTITSRLVHNNSFMENQNFIVRNHTGEIARGNAAVSNIGYMLGVVVERIRGYARVQSLRDSGSNIPVRIVGTDVFGFLQGTGNSDPELRFLSNGDFTVRPGMRLITSGVKGNVPDNIPVGVVEGVQNQKIRVKLGSEMKNQSSVFILLFDGDGRYGE